MGSIHALDVGYDAPIQGKYRRLHLSPPVAAWLGVQRVQRPQIAMRIHGVLQHIVDSEKVVWTPWFGKLTETFVRLVMGGIDVRVSRVGGRLKVIRITVHDDPGGDGFGLPVNRSGWGARLDLADSCPVWNSSGVAEIGPDRIAAFKGMERDLIAAIFLSATISGAALVRRAGAAPVEVQPLVLLAGDYDTARLHALCYGPQSLSWPAPDVFRLDDSVPIVGIARSVVEGDDCWDAPPLDEQVCSLIARLGFGSGISRGQALDEAAAQMTADPEWVLARLDLAVDSLAVLHAQVSVAVLQPGPRRAKLSAMSWVSRVGGVKGQVAANPLERRARGELERTEILEAANLHLLALVRRSSS